MEDAKIKSTLEKSTQNAQQLLQPYLQVRTGCNSHHIGMLPGIAMKCLLSAIDIRDICMETRQHDVDKFARNICRNTPENFIRFFETVASRPFNASSALSRRVVRRANEILTFRQYTFDRPGQMPLLTTLKLRTDVQSFADQHPKFARTTKFGSLRHRRFITDVFEYAMESGLCKADALACVDAAVDRHLALTQDLASSLSLYSDLPGKKVKLESRLHAKRKIQESDIESSPSKRVQVVIPIRSDDSQSSSEQFDDQLDDATSETDPETFEILMSSLDYAHQSSEPDLSDAVVDEDDDDEEEEEVVSSGEERRQVELEKKRIKEARQEKRKRREERKLHKMATRKAREEKLQRSEEKKKRREDRKRREEEEIQYPNATPTDSPDEVAEAVSSDSIVSSRRTLKRRTIVGYSKALATPISSVVQDSHEETGDDTSQSNDDTSESDLTHMPVSRLGTPNDQATQQLLAESALQVVSGIDIHG